MLSLPIAAAAAPVGDIAEVENQGTVLVFYPFIEYDNLVVTVTGPCDYQYRKVFDRGDTPFWKVEPGITIDGMYRIELSANPVIDGEIIEILERARLNDDTETVKELCREGALPGAPLNQKHGFRVFRDKIVFDPGSDDGKLGRFDTDGGLGGLGKAQGDSAAKDFVINDDLIVDGSACIGFDCVNGEVFGFDTLRLKENNLRIHFDDTSVAASFPRNDWTIIANDSANGGASKFSIEDRTNSRTPFTIEANARSHSLYVDDGGRIGSRTSTPSVEIHTIDGDTPTLRLQQDGSSGFAPQTWDVAGNETNFFVRDVTNGSTLPLRIRPGAPSSAVFIDVSGDVGVGTSSLGTMDDGSPASLHVRRTDGDASLLIEEASTTVDNARFLLELRNNGNSNFTMIDTNGNTQWDFAAAGNFRINRAGSGVSEFQLSSGGDLEIAGEITTSGSCSIGCDRVFTDDYYVESIEEHAEYMWTNSHLEGVGPTPEGKPINMSQKTQGMLNELEKAHIYIEQLNDGLKAKDARIDELSAGLEDKDVRIAQLEAAVAKLMALVEAGE
jgi:hypothetical protein